ncbi:ATP-binding protein [Corallococcus sp. CA049B]|uniref:AAA family ATPase n=1 Tax=Corallococcus sp. CA049B TaxID=2316730 RepID=UPI001315982E|nr:ATP-binding protein [Corallococcus sp. CA049B]
MLLTSFQLQNYKSFLEHPPIVFGHGFNIIIGKNNAGKTALIEGLALQFGDKPHRSSKTVPTPTHQISKKSIAKFTITVSHNEIQSFMANPANTFYMPTPHPHLCDLSARGIAELLDAQAQIEITFQRKPGGSLTTIGDRALGLYPSDHSTFGWTLIDDEPISGHQVRIDNDSSLYLGNVLGQSYVSRLYVFKAERLNIGRAPVGAKRQLASDASNLPEVLGVLQGNPSRFQRYNQLVRRVLPQVEHVTVRPVQDGKFVEILVWNEPPEQEREDLAVPLSECGTGIGQVLAMLYVLVTADSPRTIVIDEPNSFLHPGAVRALVEILREHPQHQYIVSTHSSELIAASAASTIHVLRKQASVTTVEQIDAKEANQLRMLLLEVGSKLSDVFGADCVLWVEGKTEEICFPIIMEKLLGPTPGLKINGVLHTGDFDAQDARSAFRIYERLTEGQVLLPPAVAFIFDRELRPESSRINLIRQSQNKVAFLGRRTYENYLLYANALAAVMNTSPAFADQPIDPARVQAWLDAHSQDDKYYIRAKTRDFMADVDAPKLLSDLFSELSEAKLEYNKVQHSVALTEWLLQHHPASFQEIVTLLKDKLATRPAASN